MSKTMLIATAAMIANLKSSALLPTIKSASNNKMEPFRKSHLLKETKRPNI
jgi:hypothetical protein